MKLTVPKDGKATVVLLSNHSDEDMEKMLKIQPSHAVTVSGAER
ncbi:MAG: hypothetical protein AB1898_27770 [Acidobacteriota bacterium]